MGSKSTISFECVENAKFIHECDTFSKCHQIIDMNLVFTYTIIGGFKRKSCCAFPKGRSTVFALRVASLSHIHVDDTGTMNQVFPKQIGGT